MPLGVPHVYVSVGIEHGDPAPIFPIHRVKERAIASSSHVPPKAYGVTYVHSFPHCHRVIPISLACVRVNSTLMTLPASWSGMIIGSVHFPSSRIGLRGGHCNNPLHTVFRLPGNYAPTPLHHLICERDMWGSHTTSHPSRSHTITGSMSLVVRNQRCFL